MTAIVAPQKLGHPDDRAAVAKAARAVRARGSQNFTPSDFRIQVKWFIANNLTRLTRNRKLAESFSGEHPFEVAA